MKKSNQKFSEPMGSEFNNKWVKSLLKNQNIKHVVTLNETKANYVEKAIKTIKMKFSKYIYNQETREWSKALSEITSSYNETYHRSIGMSPSKTLTMSDVDLWVKQYLEEKGTRLKKKPSRSTPYKFKIGEQVKLSFLKRSFERVYNQTFTGEVFHITERTVKQGIPVYTLKDYNNDPIWVIFTKVKCKKLL